MIKTYIFNEFEKNWMEENFRILQHDLCALLDDQEHIIYIWKGPKSSKEKYKKSLEVINLIIKNQSTITIEENEEKFPLKVKAELTHLLKAKINDYDRSKIVFSRFSTIRVYLILLIISIVLPIISLINLSSFFNWNEIGNNFMILAETYKNWLNFSFLLILITTLSLSFANLIGIYEQEQQVIIFSSIGIIICVGLLIYLQQGIFLFFFQDGSTETSYLIRKVDLILFLLLISVIKAIFIIPNLFKLVSFLKTYRKFIF